ncbi:MAG: AMP-binding protein [Betaproteobacteria bacterium]|nr:AMP-binding protein [Betaproteobacteria bacterium]
MSLYTRFCSSVLFPAHERLKGHDSVRRLRELEASQWWDPERLRQYQFEQLRRFLAGIGHRVPYYRDLFGRTGFDPVRMDSIEELGMLPLLRKPDIRANVERLKAEGATGLKRYNTGGSSGEPLVFFIGRDRRSHDVAAKWRATRWWDVDIGDRELVVWGSPIELGAQDRLRILRDRLMRSDLLPAFEMSEASLDRYVDAIRTKRPRMLFGYPSSLSLIATHARKRGIDLGGLAIEVAFVTSERLYDHQREIIESVFGCRVANGYGGRDAGFIAHDCPARRMHISADDIVVEILDDDGRPAEPGQVGEIVVTHMATADFPFVRYATGDRASVDPKPCPCGRGLPVLSEIEGRSTDFVVAADGTVMHGLALIYVIRDLPEVERFKIVQHDLAHTEVLLVPGADFDTSLESLIRAEFQRRLGATVAVTIRKVDAIPREASGKFRYVVSNVAPKTRTAAMSDAA